MLSINRTGPDWEPNPARWYYAQRDAGMYAFGYTPTEALMNLLYKELGYA